MTERTEKIAVLGGGTWGTALATHLSRQGHDVALWEYSPKGAESLRETRKLANLPELRLPDSVMVENDIGKVLTDRQNVLCVVPSHTVRSTFSSRPAQRALKRGARIIIATKGIENDTNKRMSEIIKEVFTDVGDIVILSGPSHAEEVARGEPVALVSSSTSGAAAHHAQHLFASERFRIYTSNDPIGVELGGSLKNVIAVAAGIVDGLGLGDNTKAALLSRGLLEMTRLGTSLGAQTLTFFGLSGLGDLIVTCGSKHSRNRKLGELIGKGHTLEEALAKMTMVAEGVRTTKSAHDLARQQSVDAPIINEMAKVLFENKSPKTSLNDLMTRETGNEMEGITI